MEESLRFLVCDSPSDEATGPESVEGLRQAFLDSDFFSALFY